MTSATDRAPEILVLPHRNQLDRDRLDGKVVVVMDVIFATSSMVTALAHGASHVVPAADEAGARAHAHRDNLVLAGERDAIVLDGFAHFAPLQLLRAGIAGKGVVFCSTNGAPALTAAAHGPHVYAGALLNRQALCRHLLAHHAGQDVILLCAGSAGGFSLEDFYAAGAFVEPLREHGWHAGDAARAAQAAFRQCSAREALFESRVGRLVLGMELEQDLAHCAALDSIDLVTALRGERLEVVRT